MLDYQQRVVKEQIDLGDKIEDLKRFMHTDVYASLPAVEQGLLMVQLEAMKMYWQTLDRRIEIFMDSAA